MSDESSAAGSRDEYDSHSPVEEREWSAGNPPLGHDDPVLPNPGRGDEPTQEEAMSTEEPEVPEVEEPDDDEPDTETEDE